MCMPWCLHVCLQENAINLTAKWDLHLLYWEGEDGRHRDLQYGPLWDEPLVCGGIPPQPNMPPPTKDTFPHAWLGGVPKRCWTVDSKRVKVRRDFEGCYLVPSAGSQSTARKKWLAYVIGQLHSLSTHGAGVVSHAALMSFAFRCGCAVLWWVAEVLRGDDNGAVHALTPQQVNFGYWQIWITKLQQRVREHMREDEKKLKVAIAREIKRKYPFASSMTEAQVDDIAPAISQSLQKANPELKPLFPCEPPAMLALHDLRVKLREAHRVYNKELREVSSTKKKKKKQAKATSAAVKRRKKGEVEDSGSDEGSSEQGESHSHNPNHTHTHTHAHAAPADGVGPHEILMRSSCVLPFAVSASS